ncbi:MAG TPA: class A beta-lactamase [Pyrinomonadaceae bacterium]
MHFKRSIVLLVITGMGFLSCARSSGTPDSRAGSQTPAANTSASQSSDTEKELERRLKLICDRANGTVGLSVIHIETGKTVSVNGQSLLPLYSVFKLPLAIAVLKQVEEKSLRTDQKVHVSPEESVAGAPENTALWQKPVDITIAELIDLSISRSDNTSTDKLLQLVGGPRAVTERLRSLGFQNLDIHSTVAEFVKSRDNPNTGSAEDLANLLVQLQQGKILQPAQQNLLIGFMQRTTTGLRRLRGDLPAGTIVADKTGSGERDQTTNVPKATNDVGIITLPKGRGHLVIAVLVSESKLTDAEQEKLIAEIARVAYDFFATDSDKRAIHPQITQITQIRI